MSWDYGSVEKSHDACSLKYSAQSPTLGATEQGFPSEATDVVLHCTCVTADVRHATAPPPVITRERRRHGRQQSPR
jgi:hypothetical protein